MFSSITPTAQERASALPGDAIIPNATVVMDRAFTLDAEPNEVWPWFVQLGKNRAGWYFPKRIERFIVPKRRGLRRVDNGLQQQAVGKRIDDWGGKQGYLEVVEFTQPSALIYKSTRGKTTMSWAIAVAGGEPNTRLDPFASKLQW